MYTNRVLGALAVFLVGGGVVFGNEPKTDSKLLYSFESKEEIAGVRKNDVRITAQPVGASHGQVALRVDFGRTDWPNLTFQPDGKPWDWKGFAALAFDVTNPSNALVNLAVRVDDDPSADGTRHCRTGMGWALPGNKPRTFVLTLGGPDPMDFGMRGLPGLGGTTLPGRGKIETGHITAFQVFLPRPKQPTRLIVDNVRLLRSRSLEKIVDAFGQYAGANWPGKLASVTEFRDRLEQEQRELRRSPRLPQRDEYGGWKTGPKQRATGFFRVEKVNGKWWFVTPTGHLFFSLGMDCVNNHRTTIVSGRERMFGWLPEQSDPLARFYGHVGSVFRGPIKQGRTFDFYRANLFRKFGQESEPIWRKMALDRLASWGFNTIGSWSDWSVLEQRRIPYTVSIGLGGGHARLASGQDYWAKMHDPFDPKFAETVERRIRSVAERFRDDPWLLGYFVDNELSWGGGNEDRGRYGLAFSTLSAGPEQPAKQAFVGMLRKKYTTIKKLNTAWKSKFPNWDELNRTAYEPATPLIESIRTDCAAFTKRLALRYFRTVRDTLAKYDPNHLYLGCRFAWVTPESAAAAAEIGPVLSFNVYRPTLDAQAASFVESLDRPCLIGEFHFGALDRGMFHTGLVSAVDQADRADLYRRYVNSVADHRLFVGCHWFQYVDQPLTGRSLDGENYNIGFVTVTDTPYPELVAAARAVHAEVYTRRWGK